jgi:hypothetical protein
MRIYKSIFRLDFPLAYKILDKLGEYLELIKNKTDENPYSKGRENIDLVRHSLSHTANIGENTFTLNLDLKTFNAVIEFQDGISVDKLYKIELFSLADEIIEKLEDDHSSKYDRIGFRSYILSERKEFKFLKLRDFIWGLNEIFGVSIANHFEEKHDIGIVLEAKSESEEWIKLQLGPYHHNEQSRYFTLENSIREGLIYDIDIWEQKISVPKYNMIESIRNHQNIYKKLINDIEYNILEVLK